MIEKLNIDCMFLYAACEPVSCRNMAPVSSPVKQSYADRPLSPEKIPSEGNDRSSAVIQMF